ncbi:MAG: hypothetical protein Q7V63_07210 [Gammaproteobacteria bacterium]|nr:hypothetical protein [Gammaproteobacteria bacterium]
MLPAQKEEFRSLFIQEKIIASIAGKNMGVLGISLYDEFARSEGMDPTKKSSFFVQATDPEFLKDLKFIFGITVSVKVVDPAADDLVIINTIQSYPKSLSELVFLSFIINYITNEMRVHNPPELIWLLINSTGKGVDRAIRDKRFIEWSEKFAEISMAPNYNQRLANFSKQFDEALQIWHNASTLKPEIPFHSFQKLLATINQHYPTTIEQIKAMYPEANSTKAIMNRAIIWILGFFFINIPVEVHLYKRLQKTYNPYILTAFVIIALGFIISLAAYANTIMQFIKVNARERSARYFSPLGLNLNLFKEDEAKSEIIDKRTVTRSERLKSPQHKSSDEILILAPMPPTNYTAELQYTPATGVSIKYSHNRVPRTASVVRRALEASQTLKVFPVSKTDSGPILQTITLLMGNHRYSTLETASAYSIFKAESTREPIYFAFTPEVVKEMGGEDSSIYLKMLDIAKRWKVIPHGQGLKVEHGYFMLHPAGDLGDARCSATEIAFSLAGDRARFFLFDVYAFNAHKGGVISKESPLYAPRIYTFHLIEPSREADITPV